MRHTACLEVDEIDFFGYLLRNDDEVFIFALTVQEVGTDNALGVGYAVELFYLINILLCEPQGGHKAEVVKICFVQVSVIGLDEVRL